jgi:hypothetical protein
MRYARSGDNQTELMEISAIADDLVKFGRIVTWCATHPGRSSLRPASVHEAVRQKFVRSLLALN